MFMKVSYVSTSRSYISDAPQDQSSGSKCCSEKQEQGHSPPIHRCQFWIQPHTVSSLVINFTPFSTFTRSGASLTLAHGRRYGIIGRNGKAINFLGIVELSTFQVSVNQRYCVISLCESLPFPLILQFFSSSKR